MASICLINAFFPPHEFGGAENYVFRIAKELVSEGHDVSVIAAKPFDGSLKAEHAKFEGINVYYFYPANISYRGNGTGSNPVAKGIWHQLDTVNLHSRSVVRKLLKEIDPDIVHTNNLMGISTAIGKPIQKHRSLHVHTLHDYSLICPKSNLLRDRTAPDDELQVCNDPPLPCKGFKKLKQSTFGTPDIVTGPSNHVIEIHNQHGYFSEAEQQRLQLGVEAPVDTVPERSQEPSVLYVGKHLKAKGLDTLYEAATELPEVTFHICGTGPYDEVAKEKSREHENIVYHGYIDDDELDTLRQRVSAAVIPSIWMENSPLTIYESFRVGLPVIGSDIGGIPELVNEGKTGWLFTPGDSNELIKTIRKVVFQSNKEVRESAISWAEKHTIKNHVEKLTETIYNH
ncbi:glycosyltransferase [Haloterrigena salinisoli]|uniref:glycosyltransferase n=1 Tax=Haloterrigena salinisoli TaxID=3132747 RepID=UPI0030CF00CE